MNGPKKMLTRAEKQKKKEQADKRAYIRLQKAIAKREADKSEAVNPPPPADVAAPPAVILPSSEAAVATEERIRRVGHSRKYLTPEDMIPVIRDFFDYCVERGQPPLVTTLALALGFAQKCSLDEYMKRPEFYEVIKRAKLVCEDYAARGLITGKNTVGFIFLLKQYGWRDVQETVTTIETHEQRIARLIQHNTTGGDVK